MNTDAPWPGLSQALPRVLAMQTKLHRWAVAEPGRRFDDLANLVYDPAFLTVAWDRVRGNAGAVPHATGITQPPPTVSRARNPRR